MRDASLTSGRKSSLHPFGDKQRFLFRHDRDDLDGHAVRMGVVAGDELDAALEELGGHEDVSGEPIEPSDDEDGAGASGVRERSNELGSILEVLAAGRLDFFVGSDNFESAKRGVGVDGPALRLHAEAAEALHSRADAVVGDDAGGARKMHEFTIRRRCCRIVNGLQKIR